MCNTYREIVIFRFFYMVPIWINEWLSAVFMLPWIRSGLMSEPVSSRKLSILKIIWGVGYGWVASGLLVMEDSGLNGQTWHIGKRNWLTEWHTC